MAESYRWTSRGILPAAAFILLLVLLFAAYCNTFYSPPILDDFHSFIYQEDVYVKEWSSAALGRLSQTVFGSARWIPMISFSLDHWFGKGSIVSFHVTNLIIHTLCLLAVIFLFRNLFGQRGLETGYLPMQPAVTAFLISGLWALHPVQTNAVTYLVQRMASIQAFFYVASVACFVGARTKHIQEGKSVGALLHYGGCLVFAAGAFFSKENSAMLPVMLLVTEAWFFQPDLFTRFWNRIKATRSKWGWLLIVGIVLLLSYVSVVVLREFSAGYASRHFTMWERLLTESRIVVWYVSLLLLPSPSRLSIEHDVLVSTSLLHPPTTLLAIFFLFIAGWLIVKYRRRYPLISYGFAWFFLNLAIESTVVPLELIFEHRLYLPSVGFLLAVSLSIFMIMQFLLSQRSSRDSEIIICSFTVLIISVLTLLTFFRNEVWRDPISIYADAASKAPNHPRSHANLAVACGMAGQYERSITEAEMAIRLGKKFFEEYIVSANAIVASLIGMGKPDEAIKRGMELYASVPDQFNGRTLPFFWLNLAEANLRVGDPKGAYSAAMQALEWLEKRPRHDSGDMRLVEGMLINILRNASSGQVDLDGDGEADPGKLSIKMWMGRLFWERRNLKSAKEYLVTATNENPEDSFAIELQNKLLDREQRNAVQSQKENIKEKFFKAPSSRFDLYMSAAYFMRSSNLPAMFQSIGERLLDAAISLKPETADAHLLKAWYLHDRKLMEDALISVHRCLAIDPDYAKAWQTLGFFLLECDRPQQAADAFIRTLSLYPDCPQRQTMEEIVAQLQQRESMIISNIGAKG